MKVVSLKRLTTASFVFSALGFLASPLSAVTIFIDDPNAVASAKWDTWIWGETAMGASGSQGPAEFSTGFSATDVTTRIVFDLGFSPPAGVREEGDSFYSFFGAAQWSVTGTFDAGIEFVRVSYSLQEGSPVFSQGPVLDVGASVLRSGTYLDATNSVYFVDFELTDPVSTFVATFGDLTPHSHTSLDAIQIEGFSGVGPSPIPEPSTYALGAGIGALGLAFWRRRFRRVD